MSSNSNVNNLFQQAADDGLLGANAMNVLTGVNLGEQINSALGVSLDDIEISEAVLLAQLVDDSGSIGFANNEQAVRDGHNLVIDALLNSKQSGNILVHCRSLNGKVFYPYVSLADAVPMDQTNFHATGGTPLYDQSVIMLGTVMAKSEDFRNNGVPCRTITLIITDGADAHSVRHRPGDVKALVEDMMRSENHIVAGMGINDGHTDFHKIFAEMGIRPEWILTPDKDPHAIREAFQMFSQSAVRASQTAASFSKTSAGGFN